MSFISYLSIKNILATLGTLLRCAMQPPFALGNAMWVMI